MVKGIYKYSIQIIIYVQGHWKPDVVTVPSLPPLVPPENVIWQPVAPTTLDKMSNILHHESITAKDFASSII